MGYELKCPKCGVFVEDDEQTLFQFNIEQLYNQSKKVSCEVVYQDCGKEFEKDIPKSFFGHQVIKNDDCTWQGL